MVTGGPDGCTTGCFDGGVNVGLTEGSLALGEEVEGLLEGTLEGHKPQNTIIYYDAYQGL